MMDIWKITNFAIFACALCWFLAKYGPRFFDARSADIQKAIKDATGLKMDADLRYSEIDKKIAALAEDIKSLREEGLSDMEHVHQQILHETERQKQHLLTHKANEIEALRVEGVRQVRRHAVRLSLSFAEERLDKRLVEAEPEELFGEFVRLVERGNN